MRRAVLAIAAVGALLPRQKSKHWSRRHEPDQLRPAAAIVNGRMPPQAGAAVAPVLVSRQRLQLPIRSRVKPSVVLDGTYARNRQPRFR